MTHEVMILLSSSYMFLALMLILQVHIGLRTLLFGIVLPAEAVQDAAVRGIRRDYVLLTGGLAIVIGGACLVWMRSQPERSLLCWTIAFLLLIAASFFAVWVSRKSAQRLKTARNWQVVVQTKRTASLSVGRPHGSALSSWWYSAHVVVMALCIVFAVAKWDAIPQWLHLGNYDPHKSVQSVFVLNICQALDIAFFVGYHRMISRARISLDPQDREGSLRKQLKLKRIHSSLAWGASLLMVAYLGIAQAILLYGWKGNLLFRSGISLWAVLFLALIGVAIYLRMKGLDQLRDVPSLEERHWKWLGSIYANPDDPALIVPNIYGFGWTINMANPIGKMLAYGTTAYLAVPTLLFAYWL